MLNLEKTHQPVCQSGVEVHLNQNGGIEPKGLNPLAVEVMNEIGIDISHQKSKDVVELLGQSIPYVITVCDNAREHCPVFPRTYKFLHWSFADPAAVVGTHDEKLVAFRRVRDLIVQRINEELVAPHREQRANVK